MATLKLEPVPGQPDKYYLTADTDIAAALPNVGGTISGRVTGNDSTPGAVMTGMLNFKLTVED